MSYQISTRHPHGRATDSDLIVDYIPDVEKRAGTAEEGPGPSTGPGPGKANEERPWIRWFGWAATETVAIDTWYPERPPVQLDVRHRIAFLLSIGFCAVTFAWLIIAYVHIHIPNDCPTHFWCILWSTVEICFITVCGFSAMAFFLLAWCGREAELTAFVSGFGTFMGVQTLLWSFFIYVNHNMTFNYQTSDPSRLCQYGAGLSPCRTTSATAGFVNFALVSTSTLIFVALNVFLSLWALARVKRRLTRDGEGGTTRRFGFGVS